MTRTIKVEIDDNGTVRPMDPAASLPHGRALLVWQTETSHKLQSSTHPSKMVIADNGLAFFPANGRLLTPEMVKAAQDDTVDEASSSRRLRLLWTGYDRKRTRHGPPCSLDR